MSDHDALLDAIVAQPDEDTPRLAFADWLDEHAAALPLPDAARARAALIRDDVAAARRDEFDPLRVRWERVERPRREGERWVNATLPELPRGLAYWREPLFRRGFPWSVRFCSPARKIPEPPAAVPLERAYYEGYGYFGIEQLSRAAWRGRLTALEFERGNTSIIVPQRLYALDGLDRLERLAFRGGAIRAPEVQELVRSPLFARLAALTVTDTPLGTGLAAGLDLSGGAPLRELHLVGCRVTPAALQAVLESPAARNLEALSAGGDRIGAPEKFRVFGRAPVPPLRALDMSEDAPKEAGLEALNASPLPASVRQLALANCNLNTDRTRLLASGAWASLRALDLARNPVGNGGAAALARSPHLAGLVALDLGFAQVGDEGVLALLESPLADGLAFLNLVGSPASKETKELLVGRMGDRVRV